jgi:hypothetical protein
MTGSEADTDRELEGDESGQADSTKLAKFLTPVPRPKSSAPPPPPSPSALRPAPAPEIPRERASLFSDLPVPRKNSSLRPPAAVTEPTRAEAPRVEPPRAEEPAPPTPRRAAPSLGGFSETESPSANLTLERSLREEASDDDLDFIPLARAPIGRAGARRAAIAAGALIAAGAIFFAAKRAMSPPRATAPSASSSSMAVEPGPPTTDDTVQPTEDSDFEPSAADPALGRDLRREARQLLEKGSAEEGVRVARRAIMADPNDAEGYILLAAGLQDLGRWQESRDVFAKCVQESGRKANAECVYFATRSK